MSVRRVFLGHATTPLKAAAVFLVERYAAGSEADLGRVCVVVPGGRAGRRLQELLVDEAAARTLVLTPPNVATVGSLAEVLYQPRKPFATDLAQQLAWAQVMRDQPGVVAHLARTPPDEADAAGWVAWGKLLSGLHHELAAERLMFADVQRAASAMSAREADRWDALRALQQAYLALLDSLDLWDIQTARLVAVEKRECRADSPIVLVGTVDMSVTLRSMLEQVADQVTALVFAPEAWSSRFDELGCLSVERWTSAEIDLEDRWLHLVEGPAELAEQAVRCLAAYGGRYGGDEITLGLADERLAPFLQRQLEACGLASRTATGTPLPETEVYRLLESLQAYLASGAYVEFAALVRHPRIAEWLARRGFPRRWLEQLDDYFADHLQSRLGSPWLGSGSGRDGVSRLFASMQRLLSGLSGPPQPLRQWAEPLRRLGGELYGGREWNREDEADRLILATWARVNDGLAEMEERIPAALQLPLSAAECLGLLLGQLRGDGVPAPADSQAIELLGWLELPLDDAPALVVCSVNEGFVPASVNADLFLPDSLRVRLGLTDNARRYARDAYALSVLAGTREKLDLIAAKKSREGDPLLPSRLLFAADEQTVARRAVRLFGPSEALAGLPPLAGQRKAGDRPPGFLVPCPEATAEPISMLPITAFREYLACPYRFYLRRVLRLASVDDSARELDGGAFGSLAHDVLRAFGTGPVSDSTDAEEIIAFLDAALDEQSRRSFGDYPLASVRVQIEQLRLRLRAFASRQSAWTSLGWRIRHAEVPGPDDEPAVFEVDGRPVQLRGRIDRIDVHRDTGEAFILDYKTSDSGSTPEQVHRARGEWVDLQLPMYRYVARGLGISSPLRLGYVLLPKDAGKVGFCEADWDEAELAEADDVARGVVRSIRQRIFWPPVYPPPAFSDEYAPICQDDVFERRLEQAS